jgi:FkbM family methyltransferase
MRPTHLVIVSRPTDSLMLLKTVKRVLAGVLEPFGQANRARSIYRHLTQPLHVRALPVEGPQTRFWVPTAADEVDVEYFTERAQLEAFARRLRPGDVVWDVGAATGYFTFLSALKVRPSGRVYAFEPDRSSRRRLAFNGRINRIRAGVEILSVALGNVEGEALLQGMAGGAPGLVTPSSTEPGSRSTVRVVRAADLIRRGEAPAPDCLKIDVEGAEGDVLNGFEDLLGRPGPRLLLCEVHPKLLGRFQSTPEALKSLLSSRGYELVESWVRGTEEHWLLEMDRG